MILPPLVFPVLTYAGNTNPRGRFSTVDLLIKATCFLRGKYLPYKNELNKIYWYMEVNRTEPSSSESVPWRLDFDLNVPQAYRGHKETSLH
jgi:hypothetical protein